MLIARSLFASLTTIPEDIQANPAALRVCQNQEGCTQFIHFKTERYYFLWTAETESDSMIEIRQRGGCVTYKLFDGVPYSEKYGDIINVLSEREQERKKIAVDFIREAIVEILKPV